MDETLILVDHDDRPVGTGKKLSVHREGLLHRAFSIFVFNRQGQLLLQQRADGKYHSAGLWTNTCCGHPRPGEETGRAAQRRLGEEMGITCELHKVTVFTYRADVPGGLIEHEVDHVYVGGFDREPHANPDEASQWRWIDLPALRQWNDAEPEAFTSWFNVILDKPECQLQVWQSRAQAMIAAQVDPIEYQHHILPQVSRTFALTIPQLPAELQTAVANAYLLCRMADTIEDEPGLTIIQKHSFQSAFLDVVMGKADAGRLSDELSQHLTERTLAAERDLIRNMPQVLSVTAALNATQRNATLACLTVMTQGMAEFQNKVSLSGLADRQELERYCYCVAGCVGETLTEFFIDYAPELAPQRQTLRKLARSFGAGLQLTNILKDQRDDAARGVCWLPRDLLDAHQVETGQLQAGARHIGHTRLIAELVGTANAHLLQALEFTLLIPARHTGIRRFLAWTLGLALLTLRNVQACPEAPVKVSHAQVAWIMRLTRLSQRSDVGLRMLYRIASGKLPVTRLTAD